MNKSINYLYVIAITICLIVGFAIFYETKESASILILLGISLSSIFIIKLSQQKTNLDLLSKLCFFIIFVGILFHAYPYFFNRSLWGDEAYLANSICSRNLNDLVSTKLLWGQSAPIGYLYIVKLICSIFGNGEMPLRIWSFLSFIICLFLLYRIQNNILEVKRPEIITAIFSLLPYYIYYGNELKPYMSDNIFILLSLYLFCLYKSNKFPLKYLLASFSIIIWFSFSSVFFVGSCMLFVVFDLLKEIYIRRCANLPIKQSVIKFCSCSIVAISLVIYYFIWLQETKNGAGGAGYWNLLRFPLVPTNKNDIIKLYLMIRETLVPLSGRINSIFITTLTIISFIKYKSLSDKEKIYYNASFLGIVLMLISSSIGFYPIKDRLIQFLVIIMLSYSACSLDWFLNINNSKKLSWTIAIVLLFFPIRSSLLNLKIERNYKEECEGNDVYKELINLKQPEDAIFICRGGLPFWLYKTNQCEKTIYLEDNLPYIEGNIIYGKRIKIYNYEKPYSYDFKLDKDFLDKTLLILKKYNKIYIFNAHSDKESEELANYLKDYGKIELCFTAHKTNLYCFEPTK